MDDWSALIPIVLLFSPFLFWLYMLGQALFGTQPETDVNATISREEYAQIVKHPEEFRKAQQHKEYLRRMSQ